MTAQLPEAHQQVIDTTRRWVENVVVGLNLCPFAKRELTTGRLHFRVSEAVTEAQLLMSLHDALCDIRDADDIETTLLIHPDVLQDFDDYNQFLDLADALIEDMGLDGIYQVASFHPAYQFATKGRDDTRNYSNRSPYPMLHLLSEASIARAVAAFSDADRIPAKNEALLASLGIEALAALREK